MEKMECVMDAELFKNFGLDKGKLSEMLEDEALYNEFVCLKDLLAAIRRGKCRACYNEKIREEYFISKLPNELLEPLSAIISIQDLHRNVNEPFKRRDKERIENADLKKKLQYISVAYFLDRKLIVSTCNDFESCYSRFRQKLLSLFEIDCKDVCEASEEIKEGRK